MSWPPDPRRGRVEDGSLTPAQREWLKRTFQYFYFDGRAIQREEMRLAVEIARGRCLEEDAVFE